MKRLILLGAFMPFFGQSQVIFSEDFDGVPGPTAGGAGTYSFPSGWMLVNADNRTPAASVAYVNDAWERREDFKFNVADSAMFSNSWYNPAGAADDWAWTPPIAIQPNSVLKWNGVAYDPAYPDGYEVRVMAAPNTPSGSTGVLGNMVTNSTVIYSTAAEASAWTAHSVPLNAYAGQTVRIAFRNNATDKFVLLIDDVVVEVQNNYDLRISAAQNVSQYSIMPMNQTTGQTQIKATVQNSGILASTNVVLKCDVYKDNVFSQTLTSTPLASLAPAASNEFTITGWTPATNGTYTFKFYPSATEAEQAPLNDTMAAPFPLVIDPITMARDLGPVNGALGIGAGNGGYLGNSFTLAQPVYLDTIQSIVTRGYTGKKYAAVVWSTDGAGEPTTILHATDTLLYASEDPQVLSMPIQNGPVLLAAGTYVITQIEFDSTLALAQTTSIFTTGKTFVDWPTSPVAGWANNEDFGASFSKPYIIRPIFNLCQNQVYVTDTVLMPAGCGLSDGTATLTPGAGYSIEWEDGTMSSTNATLNAGYHVYTASNEYCSFTDSVLITNTNSPDALVDSIRNALCNGQTGFIALDITGGTAPYDILWSNGMTNDTIMPGAGTYSVTITDDNNCITTISSLVITEPAVLAATPTATDETCNNCNDGEISVNVTGGTAPYTITWNNGDTGTPITDLEPGTYTATVTDANGCTQNISATVVEFDDASVAELLAQGVKVYPNPVSGNLFISNTSGNALAVTITDISGRKITDLQLSDVLTQVDMSGLANGTYTIIVTTPKGNITTRVIKQ